MYGKKIIKKRKGKSNPNFGNKIYSGDKMNTYGVKLWRDVGIDPDSMAVKSLSSFFKPGITEDVNQMSFMRYEERRKLKIAMLEEYDSEKANMTYENDPMAYKFK